MVWNRVGLLNMRSFIDKQGIVGWIFDEKTHPLGNDRPKPAVVKSEPEPVPADVKKDVVIPKKKKK
jgi:hypothetical protein